MVFVERDFFCFLELRDVRGVFALLTERNSWDEIVSLGLTLGLFSPKIYRRYGDDENSTQGIISERGLFGGRVLCVNCGTGLGVLRD